MRFQRLPAVLILLAMLATCRTGLAQTSIGLDAATMSAALHVARPADHAYVAYIVAMVDGGRLARQTVDSAFLWARPKQANKRFQFFKRALITLAAKSGVRLPGNAPAAARTIEGRVVVRVLMVDLPAAKVNVTIQGTDQSTVTDRNGRFRFTGVSFGRHILKASGVAMLRPRTGTAAVVLPSPPPSTDAAFAEIRLK